MDTSLNPIGVFDSGVGGLTVLTALQEAFPHESFVYVGDTAHVPYGDKTPEQIVSYSRDLIHWLQKNKKVKAIVAACHTSSALALETLSSEIDTPLVGMIHPLATGLKNIAGTQKIGLLVTPASAKSKAHETFLKRAGVKHELFTIPCPEFVPLIEKEGIHSPRLSIIAQEYLSSAPPMDAYVYGCTHYPLIKDILTQLTPAPFIDPAKSVCEILPSLTKCRTEGPSETIFYCTADVENFSEKVKKMIGNASCFLIKE